MKHQLDEQEPPSSVVCTRVPACRGRGSCARTTVRNSLRDAVPSAGCSSLRCLGTKASHQPASLTSHARFWSRRPSFGDALPVKARVIRWHETHSGVQLLLLTLPSAAPHSSNTGLWDPPQTADSPRLRPLPGSPAWNASVHLARLSSLDLI